MASAESDLTFQHYGSRCFLLVVLGVFLLIAPLFLRVPNPIQALAFCGAIAAFFGSWRTAVMWEKVERLERKRSFLIEDLSDWKMGVRHDANKRAILQLYSAPSTAPRRVIPAAAEQPPESEPIEVESKPLLKSAAPPQIAPEQPEETAESISEDLERLGLDLLQYLIGRGARYADKKGYFEVAKIRVNWARNKGLDAATFKAFLGDLAELGAIQFQDDTRTKFRALIALNS